MRGVRPRAWGQTPGVGYDPVAVTRTASLGKNTCSHSLLTCLEVSNLETTPKGSEVTNGNHR